MLFILFLVKHFTTETFVDQIENSKGNFPFQHFIVERKKNTFITDFVYPKCEIYNILKNTYLTEIFKSRPKYAYLYSFKKRKIFNFPL